MKYVNGKYSKIIGFEANAKTYKILCGNLAKYPNIKLYNLAVSDKKKELKFVEAKNAFISENGDATVHADSVDNILDGESIDFVKMDVEGAEYEAIVGMKKTLQNFNPAMAVCVYHLVDDLFRLQLLIEEYCPNKYDYYLRHYSPTMIETVLYAAPKN